MLYVKDVHRVSIRHDDLHSSGKKKQTKGNDDDDDGALLCSSTIYSSTLPMAILCQTKAKRNVKPSHKRKEKHARKNKERKKERKKGQKWGSETYVNDDHLYVADDEDSVFVGLRDVDVAICHSDGSSPAAVDALGAANVVLHTHRERKI